MAHLGTRSLLLAVDGTDYTADVSRALILSGPNEEYPIGHWERPEDVDLRPRVYRLALTVAQDAASGTLWGLAWTQHGETADFHLAPYGNPTATPEQPHWAGTVWVVEPDGEFLGGAASPSPRSVMQAQMSWPLTGRPERIESGEYPALLPAGW